jgi:hypothetical protein
MPAHAISTEADDRSSRLTPQLVRMYKFADEVRDGHRRDGAQVAPT